MSNMQSFLQDMLAETPEGRRELVRARLRVAVAEDLLLRIEQQGLSKAQLAEALGVSRSAVSQALTGTRNMSLNLLADMAGALGLNARLVLEAHPPAGQPVPVPMPTDANVTWQAAWGYGVSAQAVAAGELKAALAKHAMVYRPPTGSNALPAGAAQSSTTEH